mmetsp:Transcript_64861/g.171671  ORF Transcript_64861/g.171671 Transcript_64861/m.171671 type:complete len:240 (-) Transcript_64861:226-945(-)
MNESASLHGHQKPSVAAIRSFGESESDDEGTVRNVAAFCLNPNMGQIQDPENSDLSSYLASFCREQTGESVSSAESEMAPNKDKRRNSHEHKFWLKSVTHFWDSEPEHLIPQMISPLHVVSALQKMTSSVESCSELERSNSSNLIPELRYVHACHIDPKSHSCLEAYRDLNAEQVWNVERFVIWEASEQRHVIFREWLSLSSAREATPTGGKMFHYAKNRFLGHRLLFAPLFNYFCSSA